MSSSKSIPKPELEDGQLVCGWKVVRKLGSGGFGSVYEVEKKGQRAALKAEFINEDHSESLRNEVSQLRVLQWSKYFCRLFLACRTSLEDHEMNIMVMSLVGMPLSKLRRQMPQQHFTRSTAIRLSKQCLQALWDLHKTGILHRDVKGGNFAWSDDRTVYLLDFGFCRRYVTMNDDEVLYRSARKRAPFMGTAKYCSINAHKRIEQGRSDDLWGWLYMLVEFITGSLVWRTEEEKKMVVTKEKIGSRLLRKCPHELLHVFDHIRSLKYTSKPNYELILAHHDQICTRLGIAESDPMDWEKGGRYYNCRDDVAHEQNEQPAVGKRDNSEAGAVPPLEQRDSDGDDADLDDEELSEEVDGGELSAHDSDEVSIC